VLLDRREIATIRFTGWLGLIGLLRGQTGFAFTVLALRRRLPGDADRRSRAVRWPIGRRAVF